VAFDDHHYGAREIMGGLYGDGVIGLQGAFCDEAVELMGENILALFKEALSVRGGALSRGPHRW